MRNLDKILTQEVIGYSDTNENVNRIDLSVIVKGSHSAPSHLLVTSTCAITTHHRTCHIFYTIAR